MKILESVYRNILLYCPTVPPETGGILGGMNNIITHVIFDQHNAIITAAQYIPNTPFLNQAINKWAEKNICFLGMFHSHPITETELSQDDLKYIESILETLPENHTLWFPIVIPQQKIIPYLASRSGDTFQIQQKQAMIIPDRKGVLL